MTTGVTLRELVDEHGVLPPRVIVAKFPWPPQRSTDGPREPDKEHRG